MPTVARNAPCPCGSGRKHKLCCGTTRAQERAQLEAFEDLFALPHAFPQDGISVIRDSERERISHSYVRAFPHTWQNVVAEAGGEPAAASAILVGAVTAALAERRVPREFELSLVEDDRTGDPAETLALCLNATDLWSVVDAAAADAAVAAIPGEIDDEAYDVQWSAVLEREAARLLTRRHRRRLWLLVRRLRRELPIAGFPRASRAIGLACVAFESDRRVRAQLAGLLLVDTLVPSSLVAARHSLPLAA